jgi:hypothetical protein
MEAIRGEKRKGMKTRMRKENKNDKSRTRQQRQRKTKREKQRKTKAKIATQKPGSGRVRSFTTVGSPSPCEN